MRLNGKVAWITGGARMGVDVAEQLAEEGCLVVLSYRKSIEAAKKAAGSVRSWGAKATILQVDTTRETHVRRAFGRIKKEFKRLDILINMASLYEKTPWKSSDDSQWEKIIRANLKSAHVTVKCVAEELKKNRGRVVHFSDWICASGRPRYKGYAPYFTAKSGLIGLTQAQALELAPHVLVNAIAPGPILPPPDLSPREYREVKIQTPLKRWGGAREMSKAVLFLCQSDFVTGECIRVDGGRHLY